MMVALNEALHLIVNAAFPTIENRSTQVSFLLQLFSLATLILQFDSGEYRLNVSCGTILFSLPFKDVFDQ